MWRSARLFFRTNLAHAHVPWPPAIPVSAAFPSSVRRPHYLSPLRSQRTYCVNSSPTGGFDSALHTTATATKAASAGDNVSEVRVRYAPSPTGSMHLGGLRTALYNYLFARANGGQFVLRIEDTDRTRFVETAQQSIERSLAWANIQPDEGPGNPGVYGPYVQSERKHIYQEHVDQLLRDGHAYRCFCTAEELERMRFSGTHTHGNRTMYDRRCLALSSEEVEDHLQQGVPYTVRMKIPSGQTRFRDHVCGTILFQHDQVDDQVLLKSDGLPTYHLASVVDDHLMRISHVIRGQEWVMSTVKHLILYEMFGWTAPQFAHLPLLLNEDRSKLSKRHGHGDVQYYMDNYTPEAVVNFVSLLGWSPSNSNEEMFTLDQLIERFSLENVNRAGCIVNQHKLDWFESTHLQRMLRRPEDSTEPPSESYLRVRDQLHARVGTHVSVSYLERVIAAVLERIESVEKFDEFSYFFEPVHLDQEAANKLAACLKDSAVRNALTVMTDRIRAADPQSASAPLVDELIKAVAEEHGLRVAKLFMPLRLALSGKRAGVSVPLLLSTLGTEESAKRIEGALFCQ